MASILECCKQSLGMRHSVVGIVKMMYSSLNLIEMKKYLLRVGGNENLSTQSLLRC